MRTTVRLDDDLFIRIKQLAAEERMTFTAVLHQALREMLARRKRLLDCDRAPLPRFDGNGLQPGVDLDDTASLLDLMDRSNGPG